MSKYGIDPSRKQGFAPRDGPSANPGLLKELGGAWEPSFGPTGLTLFDVSGYDNDGTLTNMDPATDWVLGDPGGGGYALDYTAGNSETVETGKNVYDLGVRRHATFTTTCRVTAGGAGSLFGDWNLSLGISLRINANRSITSFVYPNDHRITTIATVPLNVWNTISVLLNGANMYIYLNGANVGTAVLGEDIGDSLEEFSIGGRGDGGGSYFLGQIASTIIHRRALAPNEIQHLYRDPSAPFRLQDVPIAAAGAPIVNAPTGALAGPLVGCLGGPIG